MSENWGSRQLTTRQIVAEILRINEQMADGSRKLDELYDELDRRDQVQIPREIRVTTAVSHDHAAVQHRDGKEPWCNVCHKTEDGRDPVSKIGYMAPEVMAELKREGRIPTKECTYE